MADAFDPGTISFYDGEAIAYSSFGRPSPRLASFIARLKSRAKVLELGCGAGHDAEALIAAGIDVTATDASHKLAAIASERIGRSVQVMRFDQLADVSAYDGVWANACLLHVPVDSLTHVLTLVHCSLRPGGVFFASFKSGDGEDRDRLGRYYSFISESELECCYVSAAQWSDLIIEDGVGGGYDGVERRWLYCTAVK
jgi:SAM-dependent methyltransferase